MVKSVARVDVQASHKSYSVENFRENITKNCDFQEEIKSYSSALKEFKKLKLYFMCSFENVR